MNRALSAGRALLWLVAIGVVIRLVVFVVCRPVTYPDTGSYQTLASQLRQSDLSTYSGLRAPGYSLFLLLADQDPRVVMAMQAVLGVATSVLLFWLCLWHTGSPGMALAGGSLHALALNQVMFEANILSETLSTFLVAASVVCLAGALRSQGHPGKAIAAGLGSALAALTRTVFVFLGPLFAILVLLFERERKGLATGLVVVFLLPVLGWSAFNQITVGYFGLSVMAGYNLTNHSGRLMERAGDEYAAIRNIYLKHRRLQIEKTGRHSMTIFAARPEMLRSTGLDEVALSRQLTRLSLDLFARYPAQYLSGVAVSWARFWAAPIYMDSGRFRIPAAARAVEAAWSAERVAVLVMNFLAIICGGWVLVNALWRRLQGIGGLTIPLILTSVVFATSILQALAEYGENARYGIPTQSLALVLVLLTLWDVRARRDMLVGLWRP